MKMKQQSRRSFLANSTKASIALGIGSTMIGSSLLTSCRSAKPGNNPFHTGFDQKPLPYDYKALEP